ncbi:MAG: dihydroneopterin triphosphate 2'-epimerase [Xanthomonadales bacterium]|nr:dihydroneopterin triphosphate 2'-epimerase [Xanthomonadales bacterium]
MQHQTPAGRPGPAHLATITVRNLRLRTFIGFNPEETTKRQDVVINIEIDYAIAAQVLDDRVEAALDYKALTKAVIAHVEDGRFLLLEKLVADVLGICSAHPAVRRARVTIDKPHALRFADSVSLALEYRAEQAHQLRLLEKAS